jgi:TonB family protein
MKPRDPIVLSVVAALLGVTAPAVAQQRASCPAIAGEPYLPCQVDTPPRSDSRNLPPRYPDMLFQAGVGGTVRVRFVVDTAGRVPIPRYEVLAASHDLFAVAVKQAIGRWSFEPGIKNGRSVSVRLEQVFIFNSPPNADELTGTPVVTREDTVSDGVPRMVIGTRPYDLAAASGVTASDLLDAQRATLVKLAPDPIADSTGRPRVTVCVTVIRDGVSVPGDSTTLAAVAAPGRRAVIPRDCPPTYASMIYDSRKRPPLGWIDPYAMVVTHVVPWNAETVLIRAEVAQGTATALHRCTVTRDGSTWRPACRLSGHSVS